MRRYVVLSVVALAVCLGSGIVGAAEFRDLEGIIEASEVVQVASQIPGVIEVVLVERGDMVKFGTPLARLKSGIEQATVELAQARVEFGQRKSVRNEELFKKKLVSIHEKDEIETEIELARLEVREAEERLKLRTIVSPIDGVVVARAKSAGEYVGEDPMLTLARIDPLYVEVVVPLELFGRIKKGMRAEVRPEAPVQGRYQAEVIIVDRVLDAASGTFGVRLNLPNPNLRVPAGLRCRVRFLGI